jgi:hypothetical protein
LVALVVRTSVVSVVVLRLLIHVATVHTIHVHLLHAVRKHVGVVATGLMGGTLGNGALRSTLGGAIGIARVKPVVVKVVARGINAS